MHFFHLDAFSSSAHIKINLDTVLSVLASGCYRWLAKSLKGYETATARRLWETFIDRSGTIRLTDSEVIIRVRRFSRAPNLLPTMGYFTRQITNVVTDGFNLKTPAIQKCRLLLPDNGAVPAWISTSLLKDPRQLRMDSLLHSFS